MLAADPWAFGWEAVVAICTGALAIGTGWLGFSTWRLAQETKAEVVGLSRPVLKMSGASLAASGFYATLTNVGAGVALDAQIVEPDGFGSMGRSLGTQASVPLVLAQGEGGSYSVPAPSMWAGDVTQDLSFDVILYCRDVGGASHYVVVDCLSTAAQDVDSGYGDVPTAGVRPRSHTPSGTRTPTSLGFVGVFQHSTGDST
jgi:hypothetical protein